MTPLLEAYLVACMFWLGIALGSFALLAMHGLTGGKWGDAIRQPLLAAISTIPLTAILFLPVLIGMKVLYPWASGAVDIGDKSAYLNVPFFIIRAAIYFGCWIALSLATIRRRSVPFPGPALLVYVVTMTFASWDWMMSLEPKWWSTIYAMNVITGQTLAALAAIILFVAYFRLADDVLPDLGNLLLATVMFWSYLAFSQFLIIWSGNEKDEIAWYLPRIETSWRWPALALIVFAFFGPFLVLLFRPAKRTPAVLASVAGIVLLTRVVDVFWTIAPAFHPAGVSLAWLHALAVIAVGAIWWMVFRRSIPSAQGV